MVYTLRAKSDVVTYCDNCKYKKLQVQIFENTKKKLETARGAHNADDYAGHNGDNSGDTAGTMSRDGLNEMN